MRGRRSQTVLVWLAMLALAWPASAAADTPREHHGVTGEHSLVDAAAEPGAICRYDPVDRSLVSIGARAPVAFAVDQTQGTDTQVVGARLRMQARSGVGQPWVTVATSPVSRRAATDEVSPFAGRTTLTPAGTGSFRVQWLLRWYVAGSPVGLAIHEVDHYDCRLGGGPRLAVRLGGCPSSLAGLSSLRIDHGPRGGDRVALTFDLGGRLEPAMDIGRWLRDHEVPATIFPTGDTVASTDMGKAVLALAASRPDLFSVGNHSWDHPRITDLDDAQVADQLTRAEAAIAPLLGGTTRPLFRPPYGTIDADALAAVGKAGWALAIRWDVTTNDYLPPWQDGPTPEELVEQVLSGVQGGSIVILHLGGYATLDALPGIVQGLHDRGLVPVTVPELLGL